MIVHDYSSALFNILRDGGDEKVFTSLKQLLAKKGHEKLYAQILKDLLKKFEKNSERSTVQVVVGRAGDEKKLEERIIQSITSLTKDKTYSTHIDPTLIGGFKIIGHDKVIDQSYKKQLLTIYRSLTT